MSGYTRDYLEEASIIQMAAGIDVEMGAIPGRDEDPMLPAAKYRRAYSRRLARAAFQLIPNFALNLASDPPVPSPSGTELAMEEAKRHIASLTRFWMENAGWHKAADAARAFIAGVPEQAAESQGPPEAAQQRSTPLNPLNPRENDYVSPSPINKGERR